MASVDILGASRTVALDLVPQAGLGDFVLVHAGYAIEVISESAARETLDLIAEFPELLGQAPD
jgi:hydrogenase expression/formation protein HypC